MNARAARYSVSMEEAAAHVEKHGTVTKASEATGIPRTTLGDRYRAWKKETRAKAELSPEIAQMTADMGIPATQLEGGWIKTKEASIRFKVPKQAEDPARLAEALIEGLSGAPAAPYIKPPEADAGLTTVFPVADLHMGMLADAEEVGEDWDTKIAQKAFSETFGRLVSVTPASGTAILAQLGDLTHNDDQRNVTPQSGHQLDVDSRFFVILRRSVEIMKWAIDLLRSKYPKVIYRGQRGNHDMTTHYAVTLALAEHYRDTSGVKIEQSASEFYVREFGNNMVVLHHGDKAKPERLALFAASEYAEIWGRTKYRIAFSGHVHHETRKEIGGMVFESVGTLAPRDAHAFTSAYGSARYLSSVTFDRQDGEVSRARVNV